MDHETRKEKQYSFETRRWSRVKDDRCHTECVVASVRTGWTVLGYEARLYVKGDLLYRSRMFMTRRLANEEADRLLYETISISQLFGPGAQKTNSEHQNGATEIPDDGQAPSDSQTAPATGSAPATQAASASAIPPTTQTPAR